MSTWLFLNCARGVVILSMPTRQVVPCLCHRHRESAECTHLDEERSHNCPHGLVRATNHFELMTSCCGPNSRRWRHAVRHVPKKLHQVSPATRGKLSPVSALLPVKVSTLEVNPFKSCFGRVNKSHANGAREQGQRQQTTNSPREQHTSVADAPRGTLHPLGRTRRQRTLFRIARQ